MRVFGQTAEFFKMQKNVQLSGIWLVVTILLLFGISPVDAQEDELQSLFTKFTSTFDGYIKHSTAVQLDELDQFTKIYNCLNLEYSNWFGEHLRLRLTAKAVYDAVYDVEDDLNSKDEDDYRAYVDLREAMADFSFENLDLHLGRQQVVWGKTDGFRVTDVVNPLDSRDTASPEFLDQRIPLWIANIEYYASTNFSLQALIIPDLRFNKLPELSFSDNVTVYSTDEPKESFENTEYGLKFAGYLRGWDFTLNYLYSWDDTPVYRKSFEPNTGTFTILPEHERMHILGGTLAAILWDGVIRAELSAKIGKYFSIDDLTVPDMVTEKTLLNYALAFERDLGDIHWLAQALQETILDYDDAISTDEVQTYLTLNASKTLLHEETLEVSTDVVYDTNEGEWTFQPEISYDYNDSINLTCGINFVVGDDEDDEDDERIYGEITYSF